MQVSARMYGAGGAPYMRASPAPISAYGAGGGLGRGRNYTEKHLPRVHKVHFT